MDTPDESLKANDVALILRPIIVEGEEWDGNFEILITGIGPASMPEESIRELVSMAMMLATTVSMMEVDTALTDRIMTECSKLYGDVDDVDLVRLTKEDDGLTLTATSKTIGGMQ
jgi:hypothetical protein